MIVLIRLSHAALHEESGDYQGDQRSHELQDLPNLGSLQFKHVLFLLSALMYYIIVISSVVERSLHALRLVEMTFCLFACAWGLGLGIHGVVMGLLEDHVLQERDGIR